MKTYAEFLNSKQFKIDCDGIAEPYAISDALFDFQRDIVKWALRIGRCGIFADCGLGKTIMQLTWADNIPGKVLILAPLSVCEQTVAEGQKFGIDVTHSKDGSATEHITITNYERLHMFDASQFDGVVLDESSILKSFTGKTRNALIDSFNRTRFKLACTATPSPNDYMELGNHAEFLGAMTRTEMLSMFFVHDGGETSKWRIKRHGQSDFWKWLCSFCVMMRRPSDLGYEMGGFALPDLHYHDIRVDVENTSEFLFALEASTLRERLTARKDSVKERAAKCAELINGSDDKWIIWCNLNSEQDAIKSRLTASCVSIAGSTPEKKRLELTQSWMDGPVKVMVSKPSIFGFGMNFQHCANMAFLGLSDSYEQFYQAVRRCWRFGQLNPVNCYVVTAHTEGAVVANINRKDKDATNMAENMVHHMHKINEKNIKQPQKVSKSEYHPVAVSDGDWCCINGDCINEIVNLHDGEVDYSIFSPPFASLYTYSDSERDMGNSRTYSEFYEHFAFIVEELLRVTADGRLCSFHCMNLPTSKTHHGYIGIQDFRGELIRMFVDAGWIYHSEVVIWKDPVTSMQRTKALGLLHKQIVKDSTMSRQGIPDYLVTMRKPGENKKPVSGKLDHFAGDPSTIQYTGDKSIDIWQRYASPIWMDINPSNTLQKKTARENDDERHICPLQLDVIERCMQLWSMPGDLVLSPFAGIGSEGYVATRMKRRFVGIELKKSYWKCAVSNLREAATMASQDMLL